jgi:hypothetical protein
MERRRFPRLYLSLPMQYHVFLPESEESVAGQGVLKNISLGGIFFQCEAPAALKKGRIVDFTLTALPYNSDFPMTGHLRAQGLVVRVEPPPQESSYSGVAVEFLRGPALA